LNSNRKNNKFSLKQKTPTLQIEMWESILNIMEKEVPKEFEV